MGKSSLLNALSGSQRAIVTAVPGTTRDIVEAGLEVGGVPVTLLDTAGMRDAADEVEQIGVQRSHAAAGAADIVLFVVDAQAGWTAEDALIMAKLHTARVAAGSRAPLLLVRNKADLLDTPTDHPTAAGEPNSSVLLGAFLPLTCQLFRKVYAPWHAGLADCHTIVETSAVSGQGLEELRAALLDAAGCPQIVSGGFGWTVNERQGEALLRAQEGLRSAAQSAAAGLPLDFWTIDLRASLTALGEVSGDEVSEEILDTIFSRFCIGK